MTDKHRIRTESPVSRILTAALETASDLDKAGHSAAVVGGAVRDTLLGREICDADIATSATMHEIISIWPHCRLIGKPPMTTALLVKEGIKLDIASFQGRSLEEDLGLFLFVKAIQYLHQRGFPGSVLP